jgi:hypothetical protein
MNVHADSMSDNSETYMIFDTCGDVSVLSQSWIPTIVIEDNFVVVPVYSTPLTLSVLLTPY